NDATTPLPREYWGGKHVFYDHHLCATQLSLCVWHQQDDGSRWVVTYVNFPRSSSTATTPAAMPARAQRVSFSPLSLARLLQTVSQGASMPAHVAFCDCHFQPFAWPHADTFPRALRHCLLQLKGALVEVVGSSAVTPVVEAAAS